MLENAEISHTSIPRSVYAEIDTVQHTANALRDGNGAYRSSEWCALQGSKSSRACPQSSGGCRSLHRRSVLPRRRPPSSLSVPCRSLCCWALLTSLHLLSLHLRCFVRDDTVWQLCREQLPIVPSEHVSLSGPSSSGRHCAMLGSKTLVSTVITARLTLDVAASLPSKSLTRCKFLLLLRPEREHAQPRAFLACFVAAPACAQPSCRCRLPSATKAHFPPRVQPQM